MSSIAVPSTRKGTSTTTDEVSIPTKPDILWPCIEINIPVSSGLGAWYHERMWCSGDKVCDENKEDSKRRIALKCKEHFSLTYDAKKNPEEGTRLQLHSIKPIRRWKSTTSTMNLGGLDVSFFFPLLFL